MKVAEIIRIFVHPSHEMSDHISLWGLHKYEIIKMKRTVTRVFGNLWSPR
jgi:hypothetical protein